MEGLPRRLSNILDCMADRFQPEHFLDPEEKQVRRKRKFTPKSLMLSLFHLVSTRGAEGYEHALIKTFDIDKAPGRSALCAVRQKISWRLCEEVFLSVLDGFERHRPTYEGLRIYAVDGQQITLPRTKSIVCAGFSGRALPLERESYMPKAYVSHAYDVLAGVSKDITIQNEQTEIVDALGFIDRFEQNSLTLYDRAYFSQVLCRAHLERGNFFLMRCQSNANAVVSALYADASQERAAMLIELKDGTKKKVWFIKLIRTSGEVDVFATNLPRRFRNCEQINKFYLLRWEVENSFREFTATLELEQWHSGHYNGIRQELYALLTLINLTKVVSYFAQGQKGLNPDFDTYFKPNFKLLFDHLVGEIGKLWPKLSRLMYGFIKLIKRTTQKRKRRSRTYPRQIRSPASPYPYSNTEPRGAKLWALK